MSKVVNGQTNIEFREKTTRKEIHGAEFIINEVLEMFRAENYRIEAKEYFTVQCNDVLKEKEFSEDIFPYVIHWD